MLPARTRRFTPSFARSEPKILVSPRSSTASLLRVAERSSASAAGMLLLLVVVGHFDLARDDLGLELFGLLALVGGEHLGVVLVDRVIDALVRQAVTLRASGELILRRVFDRGQDGDVDPLEHA